MLVLWSQKRFLKRNIALERSVGKLLVGSSLTSFTVPTSTLILMWIKTHLRNEFDIWNVHGIMNTSSLLQS